MYTHGSFRPVALTLRLVVVILFLVMTNQGVIQRIDVLYNRDNIIFLYGFAVLWAICLVAIAAAAFHPSVLVRSLWAMLIGASTASALAFQHASQSELGMLDVLSLWNSRHEATRAVEFYTPSLYWIAAAMLTSVLVIAAPPSLDIRTNSRLRLAMGSLPLIPISLITMTIFLKDGGGFNGLPVQFTPLSIGIASAWTLATHSAPARRAVTWAAAGPPVRSIVLLIDESVRGDYIDLTDGNPYTPSLAQHKGRLVDFGPASSGGNCSHYSNAILRFIASPPTIGRDLLSHPTIWQFAKNAGYRTVFIDAQAGFIRNKGQLQNFMTLDEMKYIDSYRAIDGSTPAHSLDDTLLDILLEELQSGQPAFIYANKNGAHFPYDRNYPETERKFRPVMSEAGDQVATRVNSYRNAIWWTVDRFFDRLFRATSLKDTVIIYTSDHGQVLRPGRLSHCSIEEPDPREALVPLFVATDDEGLRSRFGSAATIQRGQASHFSIGPTALELMGYSVADITELSTASLLPQNVRTPDATPSRFTTGDIFALFTSRTRWHDIDLHASYLEAPPPASKGFGANRLPDGILNGYAGDIRN